MTPKFIVVHTAAIENASFEAVKRYHMEERGWRDIGYHYYIEKNGDIHQGRKEDEVGAHCRASGMNFKSLGICLEGHHDHEEWTKEQQSSFHALLQTLINKYNIQKKRIIGHREAGANKSCPGKMIDMDEVRNTYGENKANKKVSYIK